MEHHIKTLGILFVIWGILSILFGLFIIMLFAMGGIISGEREAMLVLTIIGSIIGGFALITGIPEIMSGVGLLKFKRWSRILAIIMAAINIIDLPFGTALGIYALWVLVKPESERLLVN